MRVQVSVWQPPDESDSPTYRAEGHAVAESDPARWRVQLTEAGIPDWPDHVGWYELLMTDEDGEHYAGEIQQDVSRKGKRYLRIPRNDDGTMGNLQQVGYGTMRP